MEFSRQEYWSGLLFLSPRSLPNPGIKPRSPAFQAVSLPFESPGQVYGFGLFECQIIEIDLKKAGIYSKKAEIAAN